MEKAYLLKIKDGRDIQELLDFIEKMENIELELLDELQQKYLAANKIEVLLKSTPEQIYSDEDVVTQVRKIRKNLADE
jgi:hypothetical protein